MDGGWDSVSHSEALARSVHSPGFARDLVMGLCRSSGVGTPTARTALLLTSELVTNAVTHGRGVPTLSVEIAAGVMRVSVGDDGDAQPVLRRDPSPAAEGGRGIFLIDRLADRWGVRASASGGKLVWFELDRR